MVKNTQILISAALISVGFFIGSLLNNMCLFEQGSDISNFPPTEVSHPSFPSTEVSLPFRDSMQALLDSHNSGHRKKHICPCCGFQSDNFDPHSGRTNAKCSNCQAMERHRRACAVIGGGSRRAGRGEYLPLKGRATPFRLVHFGPHIQMEKMLNLPNIDQVSLDYFASGYSYSQNVLHGDVTNISLPTGFASGIIILHVLEHIADIDRALSELVRILDPGGWLLIEVPCRNRQDHVHMDCRGNMTKEERKLCAGQWDHQWVFDCQFFKEQNLLKAGLDCYTVDGSDPSDLGIFQVLASQTLSAAGMPLFSCTTPEKRLT